MGKKVSAEATVKDIRRQTRRQHNAEECYAVIAENDIQNLPQLNEIAFRALKLSPQSQRDVLNMVKWAQAAELEKTLDADFPSLPSLEDDHAR